MGSMIADPNLPPLPRIETSRLRLRWWRTDDLGALREAIERNREHLAPWMPWASVGLEPLEVHRARLVEWHRLCEEGLDYIWGVFDAGGERVIGGCGLHPRCGEGGLEIGYWIDRDELRKGLATELASALVRVGIEVAGAKRVEIHTDVDHQVSARIPKRLGFSEEGLLRERIYYPDGRRRDKRVFSLLDREYPASPAKLVEVRVHESTGRVRDL